MRELISYKLMPSARVTSTKVPPVVKLPTSPVRLICPFCKAKPGEDCLTSAGGFSAVHVERIKAAAAQVKRRSKKRNGA